MFGRSGPYDQLDGEWKTTDDMDVGALETAEGGSPRASGRPSGHPTVRKQSHDPRGPEKPRLSRGLREGTIPPLAGYMSTLQAVRSQVACPGFIRKVDADTDSALVASRLGIRASPQRSIREQIQSNEPRCRDQRATARNRITSKRRLWCSIRDNDSSTDRNSISVDY